MVSELHAFSWGLKPDL